MRVLLLAALLLLSSPARCVSLPAVGLSLSVVNFGGVADWLIFSIVFRKTGLRSLVDHIDIGKFILASTVVSELAMAFTPVDQESIGYPPSSDYQAADPSVSPFFSLVLIVSGGLQWILGRKLKRSIFESSTRLPLLRLTHRLNSCLFILVGKIATFNRLYLLSSPFTQSYFPLLMTSYAFLLLLVYLGSYSLVSDLKERPKPIRRSEGDSLVYSELLGMLERGERPSSEESVSVISTSAAGTRPFSAVSALNWVSIQESVYDLGKLYHPGGQLLFSSLKQRDITKIILEGSLLLFRGEKGWQVMGHSHDYRIWTMLERAYIGKIRAKKPFRLEPIGEKKRLSVVEEWVKLAIIFSIDKTNLQKRNTEGEGVLEIERAESPGGECEIETKGVDRSDSEPKRRGDQSILALVEATSGHSLSVDLKSYWMRLLGRYYVLRRGSQRLICRPIFCLCPRYLQLRSEIFREKDPELFSLAQSHQSGPAKALSSLAETKGEFTSSYLPMYLRARGGGIANDGVFELRGPMGAGLGFDKGASGKILLVLGDQAIVPFLDLFELLINRRLIEREGRTDCEGGACGPPQPGQRRKGWDVFPEEYLHILANGISVEVVWYVGREFAEEALTMGLPHLNELGYLHPETGGIGQIFAGATVVTAAKKPPQFQFVNFETDFVEAVASRGNQAIERVILDGPDSFLKDLVDRGVINLLKNYDIHFL